MEVGMWLVRYKDNAYQDAEKIGAIWTHNCELWFSSVDCDAPSMVDDEYARSFLNHIQAMNDNPCCNVEEISND